MRSRLSLIAVLIGAAVGPSLAAPPRWPLRLAALASPAGPDSAQPQLTTSAEGVILSWIERAGGESSLRFSRRTSDGWSAPRTVASGTDWFVNWADVPSVVRLDDGTLVAHWLQKSGPGTYAYDVKLSYSRDQGRTWSPPFSPHTDGTRTEHGFASLFQMPGAGLGLVWLDGRAMKTDGSHEAAGHGSEGDMSLRFGSFDRQWKQTAEEPLDLRVCECCPTAVALTADGPLVAYRDRSDREVRDIYVSRLQEGGWTKPSAVHADNWRIPACPVNGPALSARGRDVAIAWFTATGDEPKSYAAFSRDSGSTFGPPIRLDDAASLGRVDIELLPDGSAVASYIEFADRQASFRVRRIEPDGTRSAPMTIAGIAGNRTSGYPRMELHGRELIFAWVDRQDGNRVKTASAALN